MGEGKKKKKPHVSVEILQVAQNYVSKRDTSQSDQHPKPGFIKKNRQKLNPKA